MQDKMVGPTAIFSTWKYMHVKDFTMHAQNCTMQNQTKGRAICMRVTGHEEMNINHAKDCDNQQRTTTSRRKAIALSLTTQR
jgi:hypothetical protein